MFQNIMATAGLLVWLGIWIAGGGVAMAGQSKPNAPTPPGKTSEAANKSYADAYNYVLDGKWTAAVPAFEKHMKAYPNSATMDDANFFLCYSKSKIEEHLEDSCQCFANFITKYQKGSYVED